MIKELNEDNAVDTLKMAFTYELELLQKVAAQLIAHRYGQMMSDGRLWTLVVQGNHHVCSEVARYYMNKAQEAVKVD